MSYIVLEAQRTRQHNEWRYSIVIDGSIINDLKDKGIEISADTYDPNTERGSQRIIIEGSKLKEIKRCITYFEGDQGILMPGVVTVNLRPEDGKIEFTPRKGSISARQGKIKIPIKVLLRILDGNHRFVAWKAAVMETGADFEIEIHLYNVDENREDEIFMLANAPTTPVASDLMYEKKALMSKRFTERKMKSLPRKISGGSASHTMAFEIAKTLDTFEGHPLQKKMAPPNTKVSERARYLTKRGTFISYFRHFADEVDILPQSVEEKTAIVANFYKALESFTPAAFKVGANYHLFNHIGMEAIGKGLRLFYVDALFDGEASRFKTFEEAKSYIVDNSLQRVPTVEHFIASLERCNNGRMKDRQGKELLFNDKFWQVDGLARRYHGAGQVNQLLSRFSLRLGMPPSVSSKKGRKSALAG